MDLSEINKIRQQFLAAQWPQFLESVEIDGLRGWSKQAIQFQFPICAVIGENGTGKSTVLKAAASAYEQPEKKNTYYPSTFFPVTHWDKVENVALQYRIKLGNEVKTFRISKPAVRWSFPEKRYTRNVFLFDISRTLPLDASAGYAKIAKQAAAEVSTEDLDPAFTERFSHVLGRDYRQARFAVSDIDQKKLVGVVRREFGEISQFHQGAGEDATLDLFRALQSLPNYSMLVIDEIEASLHPRAQRRLVRFLLWLCRQKRIQVILSTHSPFVLEELPQEARVMLLPGPQGINVIYGVSSEFAMSRIDDNAHPELVVFVEDDESGVFLREILASHQSGADVLGRIAITPVGPANVVQMLGRLGDERRLPYRSVSCLDGDSEVVQGCFVLPGDEAPEPTVFAGLRSQNWPNLTERFGIGAGSLYGYLEDAMREPDHHNWTTLVGDRVLKSAASVWEIIAHEWAKTILSAADRERIFTVLKSALDPTN
ncbi:ATP-binding protein [Roseimicrobium sp. ORNL1]|uniref:ATP-dependent nuclease n=1 Tax=Roseimicrobium sp. ORNL1 TaxID=2711231 RepID=UPI0013E158A4|nr:ATP-binding protein [Roseimicrobium sp. ORNL1]QIF00046.1 AAA family ATPase [Roseimicrobium sp. ORNL1]